MSPTGSGGATGVGFAVLAMPSKDTTGADTTSGPGAGRATDCSAPSPAYPLSAITGPRSSTGPPVHGRTVAARRASAVIGADVSAAAATVTCAAGSAGGRAGGRRPRRHGDQRGQDRHGRHRRPTVPGPDDAATVDRAAFACCDHEASPRPTAEPAATLRAPCRRRPDERTRTYR